jgi:FkbM family methyltransferase
MKKIVRKLFTVRPFETILTALLKNFPDNFLLKGVRPSNAYYKASSIRVCNRYGVNYRLDISDYQNWLLYFYCKTDSSFGLLSYLKSGDIILDMGGNIGQTAMMMAKTAGEQCKVYSFEPFPDTYSKFVANLKLNPSLEKRVVITHCALGDTPSMLQMYKDCESNSGSNRIVTSKAVEKEMVQVPVSTIDIFAKENNLTKIDFIKIDVEGFEMNVLKGAAITLQSLKPQLFIELNDGSLKEQGSSAEELLSFLKAIGYKIFKDGETTEIKDEDVLKHIDIYCQCNNQCKWLS